MAKDAGLIEANGELKVFIDQNLSPGKGYRYTSETFSAKYYPGRKSTYT